MKSIWSSRDKIDGNGNLTKEIDWQTRNNWRTQILKNVRCSSDRNIGNWIDAADTKWNAWNTHDSIQSTVIKSDRTVSTPYRLSFLIEKYATKISENLFHRHIYSRKNDELWCREQEPTSSCSIGNYASAKSNAISSPQTANDTIRMRKGARQNIEETKTQTENQWHHSRAF